MLDRLIERAAGIGMTVTPCRGVTAAARTAAALVRRASGGRDEAARAVAWRHPLIDRLMREPALTALMPPADPRHAGRDTGSAGNLRRRVRRQAAAAAVGIVSAEWCLADTATLASRTRPGCDRSIAVVPPVTIAAVPLDRLIADLEELYALLYGENPASAPRLTNYMSLISGPSTTRDIESIPVTGAHGPRQVTVLVVV